MMPIYEYLDEAAQNPLQALPLERRDLAEVLKAMARTPEGDVSTILHRKVW
jgi:hypothetical protein